MKRNAFRGGIHPYDGKELSKDKPVRVLLPEGELVFPVSQHIGAPAKPVVKKGDHVLTGQILAEAQGAVSAHVISSVSGTVKAVEPRMTASGSRVLSVVVESDGMFETVPGFDEKCDISSLTKEEIREKIRGAGIVGMGGAGFPTHVKLAPKDDEAIEYVIINGAECEPYLTSDYRMMLEEPQNIIDGLKIELALFPKAKGIIAVEDNKRDAAERLAELVQGESRIQVMLLPTKYPQGAERVLIYAVTGRKINSSMLPADAGCIVSNVDSAIAVCRAVRDSHPLVRRILTVTGDAIANPQNFRVRIGTNYRELIQAAGGFVKDPVKIVSGGPMMGTALLTADVPVTKTSSALTCMTQDWVSRWEASPCIRCGRCVDVCPGHIVPQKLMECAANHDLEGFEKLDGMECCECGCCTYVCPAHRPLTQTFKYARRAVMDARKRKG